VETLKFLADVKPELYTEIRNHPFLGDMQMFPFTQANANGNMEALKWLMDSQPDLKTMLETRCYKGHLGLGTSSSAECVEFLCNCGADPNERMPVIDTEMGKGIIGWANGEYAKGSTDAMVLWMSQYTGMTPLMEASFKGNIGVIRALFKHGADPTLTNACGNTALDIAKIRSLKHVVTELETHLNTWAATSSEPKPVAGVATVTPVGDVKPASGSSIWSFFGFAPCCAADSGTELEVTSNIPMEVPGLKA
jgi:hypothetical protein